MYVAKNFPLVIIFSSLFAFKPLPKQSDSYSKNISKENLEVLYNKSCSTNKNSFNKVQPSEFPSDYSTQRDRNVEIPINYHVIYVAGDSIYMNVTVDNQPYPHCNWDIRDNDNNTFLLYPGFEFDYPGHSYSIGGILPPGNYSLFLYDEFGTGGVAATVTTSSGQVLASVNMGSWGNYTFLDFTAPEGDYVNGLVSTEVIEEQTEVLNNAYNDFGYTFVTSNIDSAVNAGWYYATDSHKFETGQWDNTDQYLAMAQAMTIDVTQSINYFWTGARQTSGLGVHPWSFPEDDSRHGLFCGNYTIPGGEPGLNLGITGVHEVGHYLGLYHTFENGCSSPGDEVEDTPYQSEANYSCPTSNYSCGSYDDIGNYMDYMDDECLTHFTQGQKDRIDWAIETYRPILLENTTLDYAGPVWHVATTGSDDNDGSEGSSFATIQHGIDAASDGDTVLVSSGVYIENINYNGKNIAVIGENRETTIIDGNQNGSVVTFESGEDSTTLLMNFTVTNSGGLSYDWGGGVIARNESSPVLDSLIIIDNEGGGYEGMDGGGGLCVIHNGNVRINNSIISNTTSESESGALFACQGGEIKATNCLIVNNSTGGVSAGCNSGSGNNAIELINCTVTDNNNYGIYIFGDVSVSSSIIYNNGWNGQWNISDIDGQVSLSVSNSLVQGGYEGEGNIDANPLFCDPENGDYSLAANSPAVGTGENGSNMGALGVGCEAIIFEPVLATIDDQQITEDGSVTTEISATSAMGLDMTFSVYSDTSDVIVSLDNSTLNATPSPNWNGTADISVMVTDENGLSDTTEFTLTVTAVNDSPEAFTVNYPTVSDTFSTHVDYDTTIPFKWQESYDVDSDVTYKLTIELEFFGNTYTDVHENITDTTISISSHSLDPLLNVTSQDEATISYTVDASDGEFTIVSSETGSFVLSSASLGADNNQLYPHTYTLHQNYPNPFNPVTSLRYDLPEDGLVNITVYDMMGRIVKTLVNSSQTAGFKSAQWNATNDRNEPVSAGLYLYTIQAGEFTQTKKMVLLK